jgi:diguanylate cyclase (GGDEF)-like protein/PAS domain S-box-containing protein
MILPAKLAKPSSAKLRRQGTSQLEKQAEYSQDIASEHVPTEVIDSESKAKRLLHELQVHQVELEMQNQELKEARIAESESAQRYIELFDFSPMGYFVLDSSGFISKLNLRGASLLGIERANVIGSSFLNYIITTHKDVFKKCLASIFNGEGKHSCDILVQVHSRSVWLHVEASQCQFSSACLVAIKDISERKQVEAGLVQVQKELSNSLGELERVFNLSANLVCIASPEGYFKKISPAFSEILGFSEAEFMDKPFAEFVHPDDRELTNEKMESLAKGIPVIRFPNRYICKDGSYKWLEWSARSFGDEGYIYAIAYDITERIKIENGLEQTLKDLDASKKSVVEAHEFANSLINTVREPLVSLDQDLRVVTVSRSFYTLFKLIPEEVVGKYIYDVGNKPWDIPKLRQLLETILPEQAAFNDYEVEYDFITIGRRTMLLSARQVEQKMGKQRIILLTIKDITQRKLAENKLKLAANVFTHAREGIFITDAEANIIDVNDKFTDMTGFSREEVIGQSTRILQSGRQSPDFYSSMWLGLQKDGYWSGELWNRRKNKELYAQLLTISAVYDEPGQLSNYVAFATDITLMKQSQAELERIAHYDILTNLPNRVLLADRLTQAMLQCRRHEQSLAVVFLDLDGFKAVNDTYGHDFGDQLLIALSDRMKEALREGDSLSRIGGDEFVAVLADLPHVEDCEPVLGRLLLAASEPITIAGVIINVSASIGITLYPEDNVDADQLMRHADQAMYVAKQSGKNRYHIFDTAQDDAVKLQREHLAAIRDALDKQEFVLHFQPNVNMRTGNVVGMEALIRWQHPERGLLNPIDFLPAVENNPMCIEIGEWVIDAALTQISHWQKLGLNLSVSTSVNISAVQLQQADFVDRLAAILAAHPDVAPRYLELEVLETSALHDVDHVSEIMASCIALGVNFALDDFGTGYSSLTHLRRLPANLIKIDQSFVRDMLTDSDDLAIVQGVIALAKSFKRNVIAEGVETIAHGKALLDLGCDLAQGYGIAKPMPPGDVAAWVESWQPDTSWKT